MTYPPALFWRDLGTGPERALALHCGLGQSGQWNGVAMALEGTASLRAVDLPGHGKSPDWCRTADLTETACDGVSVLLADWPNAGPIHVLGHSFGAVVALMLAQRHPDRVRSLTLVEPVMMSALPEPDLAAHRARMIPFGKALSGGDRFGAAQVFLGLFGGGSRFEDLPPAAQQDIAGRIHLIAATHPVIEDDTPGLIAPGRLEKMACPVLLVEGKTSLDLHPRINAALAARIPNARRVVIDGAGHMVPLSHPRDLAREIAVFWKGL